MRTVKFYILSFIAFIIAQYSAVGGGSNYSRFGIGDLSFFASGRSFGMGGAGIALFSEGSINRINPATLSRISKTQFTGSFLFTHYSSEDNLNKGSFSRGDFQAAAFTFPVSPTYGVTLILDAAPFSSVNYSTRFSTIQQGINTTFSFYGDGGILELGIGASVSLSEDWKAGFKTQYLFGSTRQTLDIQFDDPTFTGTKIDRSIYYAGVNFVLGTIYESVGKLINIPTLNNVSTGLILTTPANLSTTTKSVYTTETSEDTTDQKKGNSHFPLGIGFGASYRITDRIIAAGDFHYENWSSSRYLETFPSDVKINDGFRIGLGCEFLPQRDAITFLQKLVYRVGLSFNHSYLEIRDQSIKEIALSGGLEMPVSQEASLTINFQAGIRGTKENSLQRDTFFKLLLSLNASELWFMELKEE